jgi:hypothetical protein
LAGKNRDLNQAFEKYEQIDHAKEKLISELTALRTTLNEKDDEIQQYGNKIIEMIYLLIHYRLKEESDRIRFNCEQEVYNTRLQVKEIMVSLR